MWRCPSPPLWHATPLFAALHVFSSQQLVAPRAVARVSTTASCEARLRGGSGAPGFAWRGRGAALPLSPRPHGVTALGGAAVALACVACTHLRALAQHVAHIVAFSITYRGRGAGPGAPVHAPDRMPPPWDGAAARPAARTPSVAPPSSRAAPMGPLAAHDASCSCGSHSAIAARPRHTPPFSRLALSPYSGGRCWRQSGSQRRRRRLV